MKGGLAQGETAPRASVPRLAHGGAGRRSVGGPGLVVEDRTASERHPVLGEYWWVLGLLRRWPKFRCRPPRLEEKLARGVREESRLGLALPLW